MRRSFLYLSILFLIAGCTITQERLKENVTCKQAMKLIQIHSQDSNFVILDVRTPEEYNNGHIEKALNIDYNSVDFQDKIKELDKKKTYLVYCRTGGRSAKSIAIMKNLNFNNLYHVYEGIEKWKKKGYKTVKD